MGKRKRTRPATEQPEDITEAVAAAVQRRATELLEGQGTLTVRAVRRLVEGDLGLQEGALDTPPLKAAVSQAVDAILIGQVGGPAGAPAAAPKPPPELLADVLLLVLQHLDHDALFMAASVCRAWRAAAGDERLWRDLCLRCGWELPQPPPAPAAPRQQGQQPHQEPQRQAQEQGPPQLGATGSGRAMQLSQRQGQQEQGGQQGQQAGTGPSWRQLYRQAYQSVCYECWQPCARTTLSFAPLRLRLCRACCRATAAPCTHHRLLSKTEAKWRFALRDSDLAGLPHALDANPVNPAFQAQTLFRRVDVVSAAVARWGSLEAATAEHRKRLR